MQTFRKLSAFTVLIIISNLYLLPAQTSVLYGMTSNGGSDSLGTIFIFNLSNNTKNVLWNFGSGTDGRAPLGSLTFDPGNGLFYGMTEGGGVGNNAEGTIISFNPANETESVLFTFSPPDFGYPEGNLIYSSANNLFYGRTDGSIISFNPSTDVETNLNNYGGYNGLTYDPINGLYYGMTYGGGTYSNGTIFSFDPQSDSATEFWSFGGTSDGALPYGNLTFDPVNNLLYGMTKLGGTGGGTIFSLDPSTNSENVVHNFSGPTDGYYPVGDLVYNTMQNLFYGMTPIGGIYGRGIIFSFNPSTDAETVVWNFGNGSDGNAPLADLVYDASSGLYYGMTEYGGTANKGTIFSFNPDTVDFTREAVLWSFQGSSDGYWPSGSLSVYNVPNGISTINNIHAINIYPNPTKDRVNITGLTKGQMIELYDYLGQKINSLTANATKEQVDISTCENGIYLIQILNPDGTLATSKKIIKE